MNQSYTKVSAQEVIEAHAAFMAYKRKEVGRLREERIQRYMTRDSTKKRFFFFKRRIRTRHEIVKVMKEPCTHFDSEWTAFEYRFSGRTYHLNRLRNLAVGCADGLVRVTGDDMEYLFPWLKNHNSEN